MKRAMLKILRRGGAFAPFRAVNRHKLLILTYHRFAEAEDGRSTSSGSFAEQLAYLQAHYQVLSLSGLADLIAAGSPIPPAAVAITIDDGFGDAYEIAFPLLRKYQMPATIFVITEFLDRKVWLWTDKLRYLLAHAKGELAALQFAGHRLALNLNGSANRLSEATRINEILKTLPDGVKDQAIAEIASSLEVELPELPPADYRPVTWEQLREMEASGIEVGSHTMTHPILPKTTDQQLERELRGSRARLEEVLSHPIRLFCYPNGSFDERVKLAAAQAGYECAVTTVLGLNDRQSDLLAMRRVPAELDLDHFVQTTSGFEEMKLRILGRTKNLSERENR